MYWPGAVFPTRAEADAALFRYIDACFGKIMRISDQPGRDRTARLDRAVHPQVLFGH